MLTTSLHHQIYAPHRGQERAVRVTVADDHAGFVRILSSHLERAGLCVVDIAATGTGALESIRSHQPDVALVDMRMPGMSGTEVAAATRALHVQTRVIILSANIDLHIIDKAIDSGAYGYISKDATSHDIADALYDCARGIPRFPSHTPPEWAARVFARAE